MGLGKNMYFCVGTCWIEAVAGCRFGLKEQYTLSEDEHEFGADVVGVVEVDGAVVGLHYLSREAEAYAAALALGGVERDEDLLLALVGNGCAVVAHMYQCLAFVVDIGNDFNL